jgi:hypothetical protein
MELKNVLGFRDNMIKVFLRLLVEYAFSWLNLGVLVFG